MARKKEIKRYNNILKNFLIIICLAIVVFVVVFFALKKEAGFTYRGIDFGLEKVGNLTFYRATFPVLKGIDYVTDYNLFIRNDPRKLDKKVSFDGNMTIYRDVVINLTQNFQCDGYGIISLANLAKTYSIFGINIINNQSIGCNSSLSYSFIEITSGNKTELVQTDKSCYQLKINDCEILDGTEKIILETIAIAKKQNATVDLDNVPTI